MCVCLLSGPTDSSQVSTEPYRMYVRKSHTKVKTRIRGSSTLTSPAADDSTHQPGSVEITFVTPTSNSIPWQLTWNYWAVGGERYLHDFMSDVHFQQCSSPGQVIPRNECNFKPFREEVEGQGERMKWLRKEDFVPVTEPLDPRVGKLNLTVGLEGILRAVACSPLTGQGDQEVVEKRGGARGKVNRRTAQTCSGTWGAAETPFELEGGWD